MTGGSAETDCTCGAGSHGRVLGMHKHHCPARAAESAQKRSGFDCWWPSCTKTVRDEGLVRTRPKGQPGEFMCAQHAEQRRIEEADRG